MTESALLVIALTGIICILLAALSPPKGIEPRSPRARWLMGAAGATAVFLAVIGYKEYRTVGRTSIEGRYEPDVGLIAVLRTATETEADNLAVDLVWEGGLRRLRVIRPSKILRPPSNYRYYDSVVVKSFSDVLQVRRYPIGEIRAYEAWSLDGTTLFLRCLRDADDTFCARAKGGFE